MQYLLQKLYIATIWTVKVTLHVSILCHSTELFARNSHPLNIERLNKHVIENRFALVTEETGDLNIFAAASLSNILSTVHTNHIDKKDTTNAAQINPTLITGPSGTMARQILAGAPADIFISANIEWINLLEEKSALYNKAAVIAGNQLVFTIPHAWGKNSINLKEGGLPYYIKSQNRLAVAEPRLAPLGKYTASYLNKMQLWEAVEPRIAYASNARQTLLLIERGNMAGFIYKSSAIASDKVKILSILNDAPKVRYYAVIPKTSKNKQAALAYIETLQSKELQNLWKANGFTVIVDGHQNTEN
jgi:molybdate transport system substrate-binding protein